jgi:hypothetical protein
MQIKECLYCPTNYDPSGYRDYDDVVSEAMDHFEDVAMEILSEHSEGKMLIAAICRQKGKFADLFDKYRT